ncbi:MAG: acyltransferase [Candidatus Roizmanbacteria bacterium]|nr:acyltransferase [Candidatus Roizmanbacteria bacterium]
MVKVRNTTIDFLRGLAVIFMIIIHALAYFLDQPSARLVWNYSQFAVPLFVFCSAYISFQRNNSTTPIFSQILTRLKRLILPYYVFTTILLLLFEFVLGKTLTVQSALNWYLFGSGRDIGWLVILFVYFTFLVPLIIKVSKHDRLSKFLFQAVWLVPLALIFVPPIESFRLIMWIPWAAFLTYVFWFVRNENKKWFPLYVVLLSIIGFVVSRYLLLQIGHSLVFTENKYPPNLYFLSYGVLSTTLLYYFHRFLTEHNLFAHWLQKIFNFFSRYSYSLFFIHFLFVYILKEWMDYREIGAWGFFGVIMGLTVVSQILINKAIWLVNRRK